MSLNAHILIADDEETFRELLVSRLARKGSQVAGVSTGEEALKAIQSRYFDVGVFDIRMPGMDGIELLRRARELQPSLEVIVITGHGTIDSAIEAMRLGAYDYLTKPCNLSELEIVLGKALEKKALVEENRGLREAFKRQAGAREIIGKSAEVRRVIELTRKVAASELPVLIEGESGTGKELVAQAVHTWSSKASGPFIPVNCGSLPAQLLESEMFGHEKGAFTGAASQRPGLVEMADRGTLFLDEIGEMDPSLQVKLLRFLETGEFRRLGDNRLRRVDARIVAATNRRLDQEVRGGRFREDLYYRLNVLAIRVPPLRERKDDIPLLVEHFLRLRGAHQKEVTPEAMEALLAYDYPGNVRELANLVERGAVLSSGGKIERADLFGLRENLPAYEALTLSEVEKRHILATLKAAGGNKSRAADLLGISVRNLYRKLAEYGVGGGPME